jgi:hypothetical protein
MLEIGPTLKAKIINIDSYGNMTIKFSESMRTEGLNLTNLNASICDLYVKPYDNWIEKSTNLT